MINLGSKIKRTEEYAGVGVKYCCIAQKVLVTRVISFQRTATKTGLGLIKILQEALNHFNETIKRCKSVLGHLFPVTEQAYRPLQLEYMESLGVDGALISDVKMINKRVLEYNPKCQVNWCRGHRTNLIPNDAIKENERHSTAYMLSTKLHDIVNASNRFEDLLRANYKHRKPISSKATNQQLFVTNQCTGGRVHSNSTQS